jgi:putative membrane protein
MRGDAMWPYMGWMGWWMALWWVFGLAILVLFVLAVARTAGGSPGRVDDTPEQILKRRYARSEIDREEYEQRLNDLRR